MWEGWVEEDLLVAGVEFRVEDFLRSVNDDDYYFCTD